MQYAPKILAGITRILAENALISAKILLKGVESDERRRVNDIGLRVVFLFQRQMNRFHGR